MVETEGVRFLRLQFTDILGVIKNVEVPRSQFGKALDGEIQFDGSSIEGFTRGEEARRDIVVALESMGFEVEAAHHEVAPGQHEIDFKYDTAVRTADNVTTFKLIVKKVALDHNLHATFMPKPIFGVNGSGMHVH